MMNIELEAVGSGDGFLGRGEAGADYQCAVMNWWLSEEGFDVNAVMQVNDWMEMRARQEVVVVGESHIYIPQSVYAAEPSRHV
jgi:hypothetical protein